VKRSFKSEGNMPEDFTPKDLRDWFFLVNDVLGIKRVAKIWGRSQGHVYAWAASPKRNCEQIRPNPAEKLERVIEYLQASGSEGISLADWIVHYFCHITNHTAESNAPIIPDKPDWKSEALDDLPAHGEYTGTLQDFMDGAATVEELKAKEERLIREIRETTVRAISDRKKLEEAQHCREEAARCLPIRKHS
jgi:hypothetical protein